MFVFIKVIDRCLFGDVYLFIKVERVNFSFGEFLFYIEFGWVVI